MEIEISAGAVDAVTRVLAPDLGKEAGAGLAGRDREAALDLLLHKLRAVLESLIIVLLEDGGMMLMGHLTTIEDHVDEVLELAPGIAGVVDVAGGL